MTTGIQTYDEAKLTALCRDGDRSAQKQIYELYVNPMMILCLRYISDKEDAKEALHDAFCNFFKNIGKFDYRGEGSTKAWLKKIVVNQCLMHLRGKKQFIISDEHIEKHEDAALDETTLDRMSIKEIMTLIHSLPAGYRTVFNLHVFEGMGHKEIGAMLNISENTSKSQLHKVRMMMQKKLTEQSKQ